MSIHTFHEVQSCISLKCSQALIRSSDLVTGSEFNGTVFMDFHTKKTHLLRIFLNPLSLGNAEVITCLLFSNIYFHCVFLHSE